MIIIIIIFNNYDYPKMDVYWVFVYFMLLLYIVSKIPFYIKKDFEGIIPKGTPILQIIPFFQQNWLSKKTKGLVKKGNEHNEMGMSLISGWYKKTFWTRKKYE